MESVCKHICDERGATYDDGGDLAKLCVYEQIIKKILSGVTTVVGGLAAMRNSLSDFGTPQSPASCGRRSPGTWPLWRSRTG